MAHTKMLIDAAHSEETRVVVTRGNRVEEFDFEAQNRRQLRGNIYLAKVTRVEPSLQAAFVEYGGNRQGFLAFSEIHPDYYQIPVADRQALLEEDARARAQEDEDDDARANGRKARRDQDENKNQGHGRGRRRVIARRSPNDDSVSGENSDQGDPSSDAASDEVITTAEDIAPREVSESEADQAHDDAVENAESDAEADNVEQIGNVDALEEVPERPRTSRRQYKIQEVIKRRQIILVQVVKEERGNKGAALTTYLSLAGRYSVLMPNTARGGGISRKITNPQDRKHLKEIAQELDVPEGMGVILRTAGATRTKPEIKRDFEYLLRLWESVRELTLQSSAPTLVYEEGSLIKRSIRDLYSKEVDEILVAGDGSYREAKDFMRMLMPSHAKIVKLYKDPQPLYTRYGVETQLDAMFSNHVTLRSGGYLVLNQTEALVAIDVNSGRSTREHNIEDTALKTNLEAAEEVARQLRLRDLAGLVVIDFIDMEEHRNNRLVEKKLKECLKNDRAKIQVGRISPFGLLEMSRQRLRTGVLESSTAVCEHCAGTGFRRSTSSIALHILRNLEDTLIKSATHDLILFTRSEVALYLLNQKRDTITRLEALFGVSLTIQINESLVGTTYYTLERGALATPKPESLLAAQQAHSSSDVMRDAQDAADDLAAEEAFEDSHEETSSQVSDGVEGESSGARAEREENERRRRRRRRGRGGRDREERDAQGASVSPNASNESEQPETGDDSSERESETIEVSPIHDADSHGDSQNGGNREGRGRRRGRRGGRGRFDRSASENNDEVVIDDNAQPIHPDHENASSLSEMASEPLNDDTASVDEHSEETAPKKRYRSRATPLAPDVAQALEAPTSVVKSSVTSKSRITRTTDPVSAALAGTLPAKENAPTTPDAEPVAIVLTPPNDGPKRSGWWAKAKAAMTGQ
jgi:ribonuclease E